MTARTIDGKAIADELFSKVAAEVGRLTRVHGLEPGLAVVIVGNNPASEIYVRSKSMKTVAAGMRSAMHKLPETVTEAELLRVVRSAQRRPRGSRHPGTAAAPARDRSA